MCHCLKMFYFLFLKYYFWFSVKLLGFIDWTPIMLKNQQSFISLQNFKGVYIKLDFQLKLKQSLVIASDMPNKKKTTYSFCCNSSNCNPLLVWACKPMPSCCTFLPPARGKMFSLLNSNSMNDWCSTQHRTVKVAQ